MVRGSCLRGSVRYEVRGTFPRIVHCHCRMCGATLQFLTEKRPGMVDLAVGTLDDDPGVKPAHHIFVGSKAPWFDITDGLPQYAERS